jgi:hypothetical protein
VSELEDWTAALARELGVDPEYDVRALLDVAREAAQNVARPVAPLTTFLVGFAAGAHGGDRAAVEDASARAQTLARGWEARGGGAGDESELPS